MPRVERSPPSSVGEILRAQSSPDVTATLNEPVSGHSNITSRNKNKRIRPDSSPETPYSQTFETRIMDMLTSWKKEQDSLLKRLTSDITELKQQVKEMQKSYAETEKWRDYMDGEYDSMKLRISNLEKERLDQRDYIAELEKKVEDLQTGSRSSTIEIRNVASSENESTADLTDIVLKTCNAIQVPVDPCQIRDVYRLPGKREFNRPIIAEFLTVPVKSKIIEASRTFNKNRSMTDKLNTGHIGIHGQQKPIYVAEHLPTSMRKLFFEARNFAKTNNYRFCWFQNGKVFLRESEGLKPTIIYNVSSLKKLQKPNQ